MDTDTNTNQCFGKVGSTEALRPTRNKLFTRCVSCQVPCFCDSCLCECVGAELQTVLPCGRQPFVLVSRDGDGRPPGKKENSNKSCLRKNLIQIGPIGIFLSTSRWASYPLWGWIFGFGFGLYWGGQHWNRIFEKTKVGFGRTELSLRLS